MRSEEISNIFEAIAGTALLIFAVGSFYFINEIAGFFKGLFL